MELLKYTQLKINKRKNGNEEQIEQNYSNTRLKLIISAIASDVNNIKLKLKVNNWPWPGGSVG